MIAFVHLHSPKRNGFICKLFAGQNENEFKWVKVKVNDDAATSWKVLFSSAFLSFKKKSRSNDFNFFFLSSLFPTSPPVNFFLFLPLFIHTFFWTSYITITAIYSTLRILHCLRLSHDMTWSPTPVLVWRAGGGGNKTPKPTRLFSLAALKKQQDNNWKKNADLVCMWNVLSMDGGTTRKKFGGKKWKYTYTMTKKGRQEKEHRVHFHIYFQV